MCEWACRALLRTFDRPTTVVRPGSPRYRGLRGRFMRKKYEVFRPSSIQFLRCKEIACLVIFGFCFFGLKGDMNRFLIGATFRILRLIPIKPLET